MPTRRLFGQTYDEVAIVAATPIPVDIGGATVDISGAVNIGEVTIDNDPSAPVPVGDAGGSLTVDDGGLSLTVDGPLTNEQLRNEPVGVAVGSSALPSGAATQAAQATGNAALAAIEGKTPALVNGRIPVDASAVPVPVTDGGGSLSVDDGGGSLTVDGPLTNDQLRAATVAVSGPATNAELRAQPLQVWQVAGAPTTTSVAATASSVLIAASASGRKGLMVDNQSENSLYLSFSNPATLANSFIRIFPNTFFALDQQLIVDSAIYGIWTGAGGRAAVTQVV